MKLIDCHCETQLHQLHAILNCIHFLKREAITSNNRSFLDAKDSLRAMIRVYVKYEISFSLISFGSVKHE